LSDEVRIKVRAKVFPTELQENVGTCIKNIFPDSNLSFCEPWLQGTSCSYDKFLELLTKQRIRDTAREQIKRFWKDGTSRFYLNKQAAFAGTVNFCGPDDGSLGPLEVMMTLADWEGFRELVTPPKIFTRSGEEEAEDQDDVTS